MYTLLCRLLIAPSLALMGGCTVVETARIAAAEGAGRAVIVHCALSHGQRSQNLNAVNGWLSKERLPHRAVPLDCDGDGKSDF